MLKNPYSGQFIALEGLDGSGQSTQASLLASYFCKVLGKSVLLTKEPTIDSEAGKMIRRVLQKEIKMDPADLQNLFVQDRSEHLENRIVPALKRGKIVICDRYFFSTVAFGGIDLDKDWLVSLNSGFLLPNIVFVLAVPANICIERIVCRGKRVEFFEELKKLQIVEQNYNWLTFHEDFQKVACRIDGVGSKERVFEKVVDQLKLRRIIR